MRRRWVREKDIPIGAIVFSDKERASTQAVATTIEMIVGLSPFR